MEQALVWLIAYFIVISIAALCWWPLWELRSVRRGRPGWASLRLGFKDQHLRRIPPGGIWIHALSVGEVLSALPVIKALRQKTVAKPIYISVSTYAAWDMIQKRLSGEGYYILVRPLDVPWAVKHWLDSLRPVFFCLIESDLWPGWQRAIRKRGIKSVLLNARISSRASKNYRRFPGAARKLYADFDLIFVQSGRDSARLEELGIKNSRALGNIKYDSLPLPLNSKQREDLKQSLGLAGRRVLVAGSTHPAAKGAGEEEICLKVWQRLRASIGPDLALILAPRDPRREAEVLSLVSGAWAWLYSKGPLPPERNILILDVIGLLSQVYALGEIAFVGGSLTACRGHNPLEPAIQGVPVLFGPDMDDFALLARELQDTGAGKTVNDEEDFYDNCRQILADPDLAKRMGRQGRELCLQNRGAVERIIASLSWDEINEQSC
jgi:3-deoxy-D-manno-octulosonic-acid transferase